MKEIHITADAAKTVPAFILDAEKRRKEAERETGKKCGLVLSLNCDK